MIFPLYTLVRSPKPMTENTKKPANKLKLSKADIREGLKQIPVEQILTGSGKKGSLTHKQREFARNVALGKTKAQAYREVYNTNGNKKVEGNNASKLAQNDGVAKEIEAFRLANEAMEYLKSDRLKALVIHQLTQHALNDSVPPASRIRSLELLGKSAEVGLFVDRKEITTISTSKDAKTQLMDKIREAMRRNAIDADYKDAESLLNEIRPATPSEIVESQTHAPATPQNRPDAVSRTMHNIPHTQSPQIDPENSPSQVIDSQGQNTLSTFTDDTNNMNNDAQVVDLKEEVPPPHEISADMEKPSTENTPLSKNTENGEKNI